MGISIESLSVILLNQRLGKYGLKLVQGEDNFRLIYTNGDFMKWCGDHTNGDFTKVYMAALDTLEFAIRANERNAR